MPSLADPAAQAVAEEGETEESSSDGDVWEADLECTLNNDHDEDDDIVEVGREVTMHGRWERISLAVDSGAAENVLPTNHDKHVRLEASPRSKAGIGFRGAGEERVQNHGTEGAQSPHVRWSHGQAHVAGGRCEETARSQRPR